MTTVSGRGAQLHLLGVTDQPLTVLIDWGMDVSAYTWLAQARLTAGSPTVIGTFTVTKPTTTQTLLTLATVDVAKIAVGTTVVWGIDQLTPNAREMLYGTLKIEQGSVR